MKIVWIASIGLAALSVLAPAANAQQTSTTVTLVQKLQPVTRSYPGVAADILGIKTGMTVSQAEAIAEKSYPGKPFEYKAPYSFSYKEVDVESQSFVQEVDFTNEAIHGSDKLSMFFSSPVTGNTLIGINREIMFLGKNDEYNRSTALSAPLVNTLKASLMRKTARSLTR